MNKTAIKGFAVKLRRMLVQQIEQRFYKVGVAKEKVQMLDQQLYAQDKNMDGEKKKPLIPKICEKDYEAIIQEISYKCFYWLITFMYMKMNVIKPSSIGIQFIEEEIKEWIPQDILSQVITIEKIINESKIPKEDWEKVEIIGWLHQYYFSEQHAAVTGFNRSRIKKEDIPAATQLFTPKWIVQYMVDNSLGKFWIEHTEDKILEEKLEFYIKDTEKEKIFPENLYEAIDPKTIKVLDPACGTGHILVYAFDVLYDIYLHAGYVPEDIPKFIFQYNLYGLDIDEKAVKIARFALMMQAKKKVDDFFERIKDKEAVMNIYCIHESNSLIKAADKLQQKLNIEDDLLGKKQLKYLLETFCHAKEYGSILKVKDFDEIFWNRKWDVLKNQDVDSVEDEEIDFLFKLVRQAKIMGAQYEIVITNPPYMANKMMSIRLKKYADQFFQAYKGDLFSIFMRRNLDYTASNGYAAFMTPFVWMFIKTYERLRKYIIDNTWITSLIQLQYSGFEDATVPICTFVVKKSQEDGEGQFIKLSDFKGKENQSEKALQAIKNQNLSYLYRRTTKSFQKIPGMPIAYWASQRMIRIFEKGTPLKDIADARVGLQTSNNKRFIRLWHEVDIGRIGFGFKNRGDAKASGLKWFPYNKGGKFRKWYGNNIYVVNWEEDGREIRQYNMHLNRSRNSNIGIANTAYYFKKGITWSFVSSAKFGVRFTEDGFLFDTAGSCAFPKEEDLYFFIALLCSKVTFSNLMIINPTLNFQPGNIGMLPIIFPESLVSKKKICHLAKECIQIAKEDWNSYETSWDFKTHPFLIHKKGATTIEQAFQNWQYFHQKQFQKLKENEEALNDAFIKLYGLEKEIRAEVDRNEITLKKPNRKKDVASFISYAVGCMLGRYSLDEKGLVFAGGNFDQSKYQSFQVNPHNVLPIGEEDSDGWDVVTRLIQFVKITFGEKTWKENLIYIADALGRKNKESPQKCIDRYFENQFYKDHVKMYQRRPIYWLLTSEEKRTFQTLIYMHRYNQETIERIRTDYIGKFQNKLKAKKERLQEMIGQEKDRDELKELQNQILFIEEKMEALKKYDKKLSNIIHQQIEIDLDDGVLKNMQKLEGCVEQF
ncbi:BREX-1 system adenine-specific DNA-methyltransferase PglX [Clostridiaceae bacterium 35-E11]